VSDETVDKALVIIARLAGEARELELLTEFLALDSDENVVAALDALREHLTTLRYQISLDPPCTPSK
jgi:hypothetical protein